MPADAAHAVPCDPQVVAAFLKALAHPMRLLVLCRLLEGEVSVGGLEAELGLKQPSLSQQLSELREAGLVATRREAKSIIYSLADDRVRTVIDALKRAFGGEPADPPRLARTVPTALPPRPRRPAASGECGRFATVGWPEPSAGEARR